MDGSDFQKNLSRGSLFREGAWIAPTFVDGYTRNFGKLSLIVKVWMEYLSRGSLFLEGDLVDILICCHFFGKET
jgi:hypothetical protein